MQSHILTRITSHANRAPKSAAIFITLIVKAPIVQVIVMVTGLTLLALEWPLPIVKKMSIHRALVLRPILLLIQTFFAILFYQVCVVRNLLEM